MAYDGPANMSTIHGWMQDISAATGINYPMLDADDQKRIGIPSTALDGIFLLGRGFVHFGNAPVGFFDPSKLAINPSLKWTVADSTDGNLLLLFLLLTSAVSGISASWLDSTPYLTDYRVSKFGFGP